MKLTFSSSKLTPKPKQQRGTVRKSQAQGTLMLSLSSLVLVSKTAKYGTASL